MPTYTSYYVSKFDEPLLELLKKSKPFTFYHKGTQEYEVTASVYNKYIRSKAHTLDDQTTTVETFKRKSENKYGYQDDAVEFSHKTSNMLINFSQGMGKTFTTYKILIENNIQKTLVVCGQGNLQEEWLKDARKHGVDLQLNVSIVGEDTGVSKVKKIKWLDERINKAGLHLINIEALRDIDVVEVLNLNKYDCIVVDEIQAAKGWSSEQTKGLHELARYDGQKRIALSGTPILNDPLEYFSTLKFLGILNDTVKTTFETYYGVWTFDFWGNRRCTAYTNLDDMAELLKPILCFAGKSELGLPPKTREKVNIEWDSTTKAEYEKLKAIYDLPIRRLKLKGYTSKQQVRALCQYLSSTAPEKADFISTLQGRKLVFSKYTQVLENIKTQLEAKGISTLYYSGELNMNERLTVLEEWEKSDTEVLLLSAMAARFGLNLTQAIKATFLEPPPSLSVLEQCEDRGHRIGQVYPFKSYLLCGSDMDDRGLEIIEEKQVYIDELKEKLSI